MIKVPYRSQHQFETSPLRIRLSPADWWSARAFSVSYCEVITITAHNGVRLYLECDGGRTVPGASLPASLFLAKDLKCMIFL
jgi:hypothetical protein